MASLAGAHSIQDVGARCRDTAVFRAGDEHQSRLQRENAIRFIRQPKLRFVRHREVAGAECDGKRAALPVCVDAIPSLAGNGIGKGKVIAPVQLIL
ncbi:hypothetical protein SDC9_118369 [bioreactor metagenome]|uniref:Uncharacterized protein n=1 Tax=bioreactor metagenome TaxID=1076179 RepID=A0A645C8W0_9ZZZZ